MTKEQWEELEYGERAWKLSRIMIYMNDEEAYYSGWLYIWPDGETWEECMEDFKDEESYKDLEKSFISHYGDKEIHRGGLFSNKGVPKSIIEDAHYWDEQLGLPLIEVIKPGSWFGIGE